MENPITKSPSIKLPSISQLTKVQRTRSPLSSVPTGGTIKDTYTSNISDLSTIRRMKPVQALRNLDKLNGLMSAAVQSYISLSMSGYTVTAYENDTKLFSKKGTQDAQTVISQISTLSDYSKGYSDKSSIDEILQTLIKETILTGACGLELVMNSERYPSKLVVFPTEDITWKRKGQQKHPEQQGSGTQSTSLNYPNIWVENLNKGADKVTATSMLQPCLNTIFLFIDFLEDMARAVKKSGHSKVVATIILDKAVASAPEDVKSDPKKLTKYLLSVKKSAEQALESMEPDDSLVSFDNIEFDILNDTGSKADYSQMLESLNGLVATSLKSMPSVLGLRLGKGGQSVSNSETLIYLSQVQAIRAPTETAMSRALTLSTRLLGSNTYVEFKFKPINLRPEGEVEAHKAMYQSRVLDALSLGHITDDEACHKLGWGFRDNDAPKLSGTLFRHQTSISVDETKISPNSGAQERALTSDTTKSGRGKNQ